MVARHIKVDDEVWKTLHLLKMFLKKRSLNDVIRQILEEWENSDRGVKIGLRKTSEP